MIYTLCSAVDTRDQKPMLWLARQPSNYYVPMLALFSEKTHPAYVKRLTFVSPDSINWDATNAAFQNHADVSTITLIDQWEAPE